MEPTVELTFFEGSVADAVGSVCQRGDVVLGAGARRVRNGARHFPVVCLVQRTRVHHEVCWRGHVHSFTTVCFISVSLILLKYLGSINESNLLITCITWLTLNTTCLKFSSYSELNDKKMMIF